MAPATSRSKMGGARNVLLLIMSSRKRMRGSFFPALAHAAAGRFHARTSRHTEFPTLFLMRPYPANALQPPSTMAPCPATGPVTAAAMARAIFSAPMLDGSIRFA